MRIEAYAAREGNGSRLIVDGEDVTYRTTYLAIKVEVGKPTEVIWRMYPEPIRLDGDGVPIQQEHRARPDELIVDVVPQD